MSSMCLVSWCVSRLGNRAEYSWTVLIKSRRSSVVAAECAETMETRAKMAGATKPSACSKRGQAYVLSGSLSNAKGNINKGRTTAIRKSIKMIPSRGDSRRLIFMLCTKVYKRVQNAVGAACHGE